MTNPYLSAVNWQDDDGSGTVGTTMSAGHMNSLESAVQDASMRTVLVDLVCVTNVDLATTTGLSQDGLANGANYRVLLVGQTNTADNGLYQVAWVLVTGTLRRTIVRLPEDALLDFGCLVCVQQGFIWGRSIWQRTWPVVAGERKFQPAGGIGVDHLIGAAGEAAFLNTFANANAASFPTYWYINGGRCYVAGVVTTGNANPGVAFRLPIAPKYAKLTALFQDSALAGAWARIETDGSVTVSKTSPIYLDFSFPIATP